MTRKEFYNLKIGDRIQGNGIKDSTIYTIKDISTPGYYNLGPGMGYATIPGSWDKLPPLELTEEERLQVRDTVMSLISIDWDQVSDNIRDFIGDIEDEEEDKYKLRMELANKYLDKVARKEFEEEFESLVNKYFDMEV